MRVEVDLSAVHADDSELGLVFDDCVIKIVCVDDGPTCLFPGTSGVSGGFGISGVSGGFGISGAPGD